MKAEDLKTKTEDELKKLLLEKRKEQLNLRFQKTGGTLDKKSEVRNVRRTIARIKTYLNKKTYGETPKSESKKKAGKKKAA